MNFLAYSLLSLLNSSPLSSKFINWSNEAAAGLNKIVFFFVLDNFISLSMVMSVLFMLLVIVVN